MWIKWRCGRSLLMDSCNKLKSFVYVCLEEEVSPSKPGEDVHGLVWVDKGELARILYLSVGVEVCKWFVLE